MMILIGTVVIKPGRMEEALTLSRRHVCSSRKESGCIDHAVYLDPENSLRLVFVQRWADPAAVELHYLQPECRQFLYELTQLANAAPYVQNYQVI